MDDNVERERLRKQLEQATRLVASVNDPTTLQRIRDFISELRQKLERRKARRRSQEEIRVRARSLWEAAGRPAGRDEEFCLKAKRELAQDRLE